MAISAADSQAGIENRTLRGRSSRHQLIGLPVRSLACACNHVATSGKADGLADRYARNCAGVGRHMPRHHRRGAAVVRRGGALQLDSPRPCCSFRCCLHCGGGVDANWKIAWRCPRPRKKAPRKIPRSRDALGYDPTDPGFTRLAMLAATIVVIHLLIMVFITAGLPLIYIGAARRWRWIRDWRWRVTHLAAIGLVAAESLAGIVCPLTLWEDALRGQESKEGFIERW